MGSEFSGFDLEKVEASDLEDIEAKVVLKAKGKTSSLARREGTSLSIPAGPKEHLVRQYAALSERKLDLRLGAQTTTESEWVLKLPAGFRPTGVPQGGAGLEPLRHAGASNPRSPAPPCG